jgi:hypothetical protein
MTVRALRSARADISDVVLERLPPLRPAVVTAEHARGETCNRAQRENQHQCFASHVLHSFVSAKGPIATTERPGLDDVGEDLALPLIQGFVNLGERIEGIVANAVNDGVVAIEDGFDCGAVECLGADHLRDVGPRASEFAFGVVDFVQQRVDGFADYLFLTGCGVESVEQAIQDEAPATRAKATRPTATIVAALPAVMVVVAPRERRGEA